MDDFTCAFFCYTFTIQENHVSFLRIFDNGAPERSIDSGHDSAAEDPFSPQFMEQLPATFSV